MTERSPAGGALCLRAVRTGEASREGFGEATADVGVERVVNEVDLCVDV